ncbi:hypothetical protein BU14_0317s0005 [Porphyra umbilicalis]|uniref:Uncharacterized protein n=1 Tax=Porphyra umbilicalis TaxID=2786 RepID=A0A1X6NZI2_PORUM|nr:hypothetical protein BU14_0317s0005 [Porphyra umbilicalis]|eukprot:OSX73945.1 hypothetical protein BU14_0317s0005 [Porphyra umbilicalis]
MHSDRLHHCLRQWVDEISSLGPQSGLILHHTSSVRTTWKDTPAASTVVVSPPLPTIVVAPPPSVVAPPRTMVARPPTAVARAPAVVTPPAHHRHTTSFSPPILSMSASLCIPPAISVAASPTLPSPPLLVPHHRLRPAPPNTAVSSTALG